MPASRPSLVSAHWLYLLSMVLILTLGSFMQSQSISWGLLATEFGLILLPMLLFVRVGRLPVRDVLPLRWPGLRLVALGALAGAGTWGLGIALQGLATTVLGYTPPSGLSAVPSDPLNLLVFVVALVVAAPLCEEPFFRGYLLSAYGRCPPSRAWLSVALLFAFFHLQFSGLLGLLPIALVLGLLAQRSRSLAPAVAAHMANNGLAAGLTVAVKLNPALANSPALTVALLCVMLAGPLVAAAALWLFVRATRPAPAAAPTSQPAPAPARVGGRAYWPLAGAGLIYLAVAGLELVMGRFPTALAERTLRLEPSPWTQPTSLAYDLWNVENESVGEAACAFTPQGSLVGFDCLTRQRHFEARLGQSQYAGGTYTLSQVGHWDAATMRLVDARLEFVGEYGGWTAQVATDPTGLRLALDANGPATLPADAVLAAEWPWRLMVLPFGKSLYFGSRFSEVGLAAGLSTGEVQASAVLVQGKEELRTPPGDYLHTYKVIVGQQTAWYAADSPHTLLRYNDGYGVTWTLRSPAPDPTGF
jgi:membrane protease YdiL (CAAX protease family)